LKKQLDQLTSKSNALTSEIKVLEARIAEIKKTEDGYDEAVKKLGQELAADQTQINHKSSMAEAAVKDQKSAIDKKIQAFDDALSASSKNADNLKTAAESAQQAYTTAAAEAQAKLAAYADARNTQKTIEAQLKELKTLLDQASKAESQDDVVAMYFLLKEASALAADITIPTAPELTTKLKKTQADAETAKSAAAQKRADAEQKNQQYLDAKKALDAAKTTRRAEILKQLNEIKVPAAV
jgi:chromosome segregation ATPase